MMVLPHILVVHRLFSDQRVLVLERATAHNQASLDGIAALNGDNRHGARNALSAAISAAEALGMMR
jgi:hypothetical protein